MEYKIFGCKVNKYYLNKWLDYFELEKKSNNIYEKDKYSNSLLIASCVVTDRAKAKWIKIAKQAIGVGKHVYITGCGAFDRGKKITEERFYAIYPELLSLKNSITLLGEEPDSSTTREVGKHTFKPGTQLYTKKFIVIQNGCDSYCTFCLTVQKRGKHITVPFTEIVEQINDFSAIGGQEVVLTGINLSAWGNKTTNNWQTNHFGSMLKKLLQLTDIPRIRISSLGPEFLDDDFFEAVQDPRFLPHFHFSIQSFDTSVLKSMRRHYTYEDLEHILKNIRKLEKNNLISIGADIITGFPGETEEQFHTTLDAIEKFNINKLHAFPFSPHRKGDKVPAGSFKDQVSNEVKKQRQQEVLSLGEIMRKSFIQQNYGSCHSILIEGKKNGVRQGRSENYIAVKVAGEYERGELVTITLDESNCTGLMQSPRMS